MSAAIMTQYVIMGIVIVAVGLVGFWAATPKKKTENR